MSNMKTSERGMISYEKLNVHPTWARETAQYQYDTPCWTSGWARKHLRNWTMAKMAWKIKMTAQMENAVALGVIMVWYFSLNSPFVPFPNHPFVPTP